MILHSPIRSILNHPLSARRGGGGGPPVPEFDPLSLAPYAFMEVSPSTTWADTAGTTPATVNAIQGVARVDDLSGGARHVTQATASSRMTLRGTPTGPNLVDDPCMFVGSGWTGGTGWTVTAPQSTASAATGPLNFSLSATSGRVYLIEYTVTRTAGSVTVNFGGAAGAARSLSGRYFDYVVATSTAALSFTTATFSGTVGNVRVYDASADSVGGPYWLEGLGGKSATATISISSYPLTLAAQSRSMATGSTPVCLGVQLSSSDYKALSIRGAAIDRKESTLSSSGPVTQTAVDQFILGDFSASAVTCYGDMVPGNPTAMTNSSSTNTTLGFGAAAGLSMIGYVRSIFVVGRSLTSEDHRNLASYFGSDRAFQCWGDSMTSGLGAAVAGWTPRLSQSMLRVAHNRGVGGETSSQITARVLADTTDRMRWINLFWMGTNDNPAAVGWSGTLANIASSVAATQGAGRYIVIAPHRTAGGSNITKAHVEEIEASLLSLYGARFVDVRGYLSARHDGSANDLADIADGLVPRSLRSDTIHLNDKGYQLVSDCVEASLRGLGWG